MPCQQALAAQHLVAAGDAAVEVVRHVEQGALQSVTCASSASSSGGHVAGLDGGMDARQQLAPRARVHTLQCPSRPPLMRTVTGSAVAHEA